MKAYIKELESHIDKVPTLYNEDDKLDVQGSALIDGLKNQ